MTTNSLIKVTIENNQIVILNKTSDYLDNCFVILENIFFICLCKKEFNLKPNEIINFPIENGVFDIQHWGDKNYYLKIYNKKKLIFKKTFNDKTKCFVLLSNKKFEKLTEQLIVGLTKYSTIDIKHYTIGYQSILDYDYLENIEFNVDGDINDPQFMQFIKPLVFCDILEKGYENVVFLDSDIQVKSNINNIFSFVSEIEDGPIFQKSYWNYTLVNGEYAPGPKLSSFLELPIQQKWGHGVTNIILFNKRHYDLFVKWKQICLSNEINEIRKEEFLHDELILNCLLWKYNILPKFFWFVINVRDETEVDFFYDYDFNDYEYEVNLNNFNLGHYSQSFFYYDKSNILGFHCVKDPKIAEKINNIIHLKEIKKIKQVSNMYSNIEKNNNIIRNIDPTFNIHFVNGAFVEIKNSMYNTHKVKFINKSNNIIEHEGEIGNDCWIKANKSYFIDWKIEIHVENKVYVFNLNLENKRVFIPLESNSLGDTLAWFPYVEEFRKKHNCKVICSTFWNDFFKENYPEIQFVNPGQPVNNIMAQYNLGWYYNDDNNKFNEYKNPNEFKNQPMQKTASDILGLEYEEIVPKIKLYDDIEKENIVSIAIHSTAQAKYWNNKDGWQQVIDYLNSKGYKVILLSREPDGYMGNIHPKGIKQLPKGPIDKVIKTLQKSKLFIGIGSGLSWLSWATNTPTILISGFSYPYTETTTNTYRIETPKNKCTGCFNTHRLDAGDWNWCPINKNTDKMFECSKSIEASQVIEVIDKILT